MNKLRNMVVVVTLLGLFLVGCGTNQDKPDTQSPGQSKTETITLKMADSFPVTHIQAAEINKFFMQRVGELTNGKVKIEYYPAEQLGKLKDLLNLTSQGIVDIGYAAPLTLAGQLPLNNVMGIPCAYYTATEGEKIYMRLAQGVLLEEFQKHNVRPLYVCTTPQYDIATTKKAIKQVQDFKGLKIRTSGGLTDKTVELLGGTPVTIPTPELFEAMQRGVVDGCLTNNVTTKGYRIDEIMKYCTLGAGLGGFPVAYVINEKSWQKLPPDIQEALKKAGEETAEYAGKVWDKRQEELTKEFESKGITFYRVTQKDREQLREVLKEIGYFWAEDMEKRGLPGKKVYAEFEKICQEVVKA